MRKSILSKQQTIARVTLVALLATASAASADPVAFVVNGDSHTVSVVDIESRQTRASISTVGQSGFSGLNPTDVLVDPRTGRVFVSSRERLVSFDGRMADGRGFYALTASDEGSGVALDEAGWRVFMSHEQVGGSANGIVSEYSLGDPNAPAFVREHEVVGVPDLRFIAFDARNRRVYVVDDGGAIARTHVDDMVFTRLAGVTAPNPGGILADPNGGVWITSRTPAKLVRVFENGSRSEWTVPDAQHPRGMAWDREVAGALLIAVDDRNRIVRFQPASGAFSNAMTTDARPQDVGTTSGGAIVSVNRIGASVLGSVTANGLTIAATDLKSTALAVADVARLTPTPNEHKFCYKRLGDRDEATFRIQNTRVNRQRIDLTQLQIGGANPSNYVPISNTCSAARLNWGDTCQFRLRFTASGTSVEPPPSSPYGGATWPAEVRIASTDGSSSVTVPIRAAKLRNVDGRCTDTPPLLR